MQAPSPEFWLNLVFIGLALGSLAVWLPIAVRWNNEGSVLPYEPRQRVPWNFLGAVPAVLFVVLAFVRALQEGDATVEVNQDEILWESAGSAVVLIGLVIAVATAIIHLAGGTYRDLGLPRDAAQLRRDAVLGALGWLAALLPVFGVQWVLLELFGEPSQNPVIKLVQEYPDWRVFAAAIVAAAIVAPICEEFVFRLLLQGWLERVEDGVIGYRATERRGNSVPVSAVDIETQAIELLPESPIVAETEPARQGLIRGISHGFIPIAVSSLLFSLAHIGYGPDPVALFVLALFLGYLYQRTHRIVPCIVVHMLFNALSLLVLWLTLPMKQP